MLLYRGLEVRLPAQLGSGASKDPLTFYLQQVLAAIYLYFHLLLALVLIKALRFLWRHRVALRSAPWGTFWGEVSGRFALSAVGGDLRLINAPLVMLTLFALLKHLIPHINHGIFDEWFLGWERPLCGGVSCSEMLQATLGRSSTIVTQVGQHYFWYYPYLAVVILYFVLFAERRLAEEFIFALVAVFFFGTVLVYAVPTWGPIYYTPHAFEFMKGTDIYGLQQRLWHMKALLEQGRSSGDEIFMISGFPSLHVAVTLLGSMYLGVVNRPLALCSWVFLLLTLNSTIYLGWHYVLDNIGAVALVFFVKALAGRLAGVRPVRSNSQGS